MTLSLFAASLVLAGAAPAADRDSPTRLAKPVRLIADGVPIDTGEHIAHSGPLLADYDGDGKQDLLVGNFRGHVQLYKNVGSNQEPKFTSDGLLKAQGQTVRIHNW